MSTYFLVCKGVSIDDVGVSRDIVYQEIRPGAGFETGDFVQEKLEGGGYRRTTPTHFQVVRLYASYTFRAVGITVMASRLLRSRFSVLNAGGAFLRLREAQPKPDSENVW